jgi:hypothetical protein
MISQATQDILSRYCGEGGEPIFLDAGHFEYDPESTMNLDELIVHSGCLEFVYNVASRSGKVIHIYTIDAPAGPGSLSPIDFIEKSDAIQQEVIPDFSCPHLESVGIPSELFSFGRFLAPALSEGDLLDGPFRHDPEFEYLDSGYDADVALVIGRLVKDIFSRFQSFDCECAAIANKAIEDLSETFRDL